MSENHPEAIRADYVLTESGGIHSGSPEAPAVGVTVGEKGVAWRRLTVRGTPGHGSMPYRTDNALVIAAAVVQRIAEYAPEPRVHELWRAQVAAMDLPEEVREQLLDEGSIDGFLASMDSDGMAGHIHAVSLALTCFGGGVESVRAMGESLLQTVHLSYGDRPDRPQRGVVLNCDVGAVWLVPSIPALMMDPTVPSTRRH